MRARSRLSRPSLVRSHLVHTASIVVAGVIAVVAVPLGATADQEIVYLRAGGARPLEFDPARLETLAAVDSASAVRAAARLVRDGTAVWAEPVAEREPADAIAWARALAPTRGGTNELPNDPLLRDGRQWGLINTGGYTGIAGADIHAVPAWRHSCGAAWLKLAIVDTGIDPGHPDLARDLDGGPRITNGINVSADPSGSWADSAAHGTAVAGVMAALTGDGAHFDSLGIAGVCGGDGASNPGCRIVPIKITSGHATIASSLDIARGILAAVAAGARVVNVSFGGTGPSRVEREALRYAMERGCLVVAASGNRGASAPRAPFYPAAYAADGLCLQVGATDAWDRRAAFSSYGPGLDLMAPGEGIWTTYLTYPSAAGVERPGYVAASGTSFAAPFATGVAGLVTALEPELAPDDVRRLLVSSARDIGAPGVDDETGWGVLDANAALEALAPDVGVWHDEYPANSYVDQGVDSLVVGETGPGTMTGPRTYAAARRLAAEATIAVPDSFDGPVRVWPRVAGTSTVRGDYRLPYFAPYAEVEWTGPRTFTLRGWLYRVADGGDSLDIPLPFDQARFGFTVLGHVARPLARGREPRREPLWASLRVEPNPFTASLRIERPADTAIDILDVAGRRVRAWPADGSVGPSHPLGLLWDGRDSVGQRLPPGLYWVRARTPRGSAQRRVIKLE